jgi:hypothetical protein
MFINDNGYLEYVCCFKDNKTSPNTKQNENEKLVKTKSTIKIMEKKMDNYFKDLKKKWEKLLTDLNKINNVYTLENTYEFHSEKINGNCIKRVDPKNPEIFCKIHRNTVYPTDADCGLFKTKKALQIRTNDIDISNYNLKKDFEEVDAKSLDAYCNGLMKVALDKKQHGDK